VKKWLPILLVLAGIGGGFAYYSYNSEAPAPTVNTAVITRGDVVDTVGATGTLQAVTTVQVGTQVSGTIQALFADFNSLVRKGQVLARLDPSLFQTQIEQANANLIRAQADLERLRVSLEDARTKLARAQELSERQLIPKSDLETAQVNVRSIDAQIRSSEAQVTQARASLNQNEVNLQHTVIAAPIDGLVISRNVDVGQTVAASMQAPTLFVLAADLTKMQVVANLDESDVGRIRPGQHVTFRVDAYPAEDFDGAVSQVRLQPIVQQNVVTYATVIDVPNPQLKLKPGMTANVNVEINKRTNVLRVPNAALRFRPTNEIFAALGQAPLDPGQLRSLAADAQARGNRGRGAPQEPSPIPFDAPTPAPSASPSEPAAGRTGQAAAAGEAAGGPQAEGAGGAGRGGRPRLADRLQNMTPEQRQQALEQMRARGLDPAAMGSGADGAGRGGRARGRGLAGGAQPTGRGRGDAAAGPSPADRDEPAPARDTAPAPTTFDALFAPLPIVESAGRVWTYVDGQLAPLRVRTGISDGQNSELIEGDLEEGAELVTNVLTGNEARPATPTGGFPGLGRGGGGNNNRGGGNRGR
jgi:HlyD family secretion protein